MKKRHFSLSVQILVLCLCFILIISSTITAIFYFNVNQITENNIKEKASITMQFLGANLTDALAVFNDIIQSGAAIFSVLPSEEVMNDVATKINDTYPDLLDYYYGTVTSIYAPGGFWVSGNGWYPETDPEWDYSWDPPERLWHKSAMANPGVTMLVDPYVDAQTGKLVVTFSQTVSNDAGNITGVIATDVTLDRFSEIVASGKITSDGFTVLIDNTGLFLVHPDSSYVLEKNIFDEMPFIDKDAMLSGNVEVLLSGSDYYCFAPVEGTEWFLVSTGSLNSFWGEVRRILLTVIIVVLALTAAAGCIAIALSYFLTKPFRQLVSFFNVISGGDFTASPPDYSSREASALSVGFHSFSDSISALVRKIKDSAIDIDSVSKDLSLSIKETQAVISEVNDAVSSIHGDVTRENQAIALNETAVNRVMGEIENLNTRIKEQNIQIGGASSAVEEMVANLNSIENSTSTVNNRIKDLVHSSQEEKRRLSETAEAAKEVEKESEALAVMNKVISDVATQTNLLSMNAAIEAAHAGEAGRGFAVVAQEIRKLAETTAQQSKSSEDAIRLLQKGIKAIASSAIHVEESFDGMINMIHQIEEITTNLKNATEEQGIGSGQLLSSISAINTITADVEAASQTMKTSASEAVAACVELAKLSHNMDDKVSKCDEGAKSLTSNSESVVKIVEHTNVAVELLEKSINPFKIN